MFQDWEAYNNLSRFVIVIAFMAFISILIFDTYLVVFNVRTIYQYQNNANMKINNMVRLSLDYGDGRVRVFEGEAGSGGLTLAGALALVSEAGGISINFWENSGIYLVKSIDNLSDSEEHYWELSMPRLNWSKRLGELDIRQSIFVSGTSAVLTYK